MPESANSIHTGPSVIEVFVFMSEYGFRVEPGFAVARAGDRIEFRNVTRFRVALEFEPRLCDRVIPLSPGATEGFAVPEEAQPGFYPYEASVGIGMDQSLHAIGGSGPGVIIKP